jgi:NADH-quinone oxidoreductase subunit L
MSGETILLMMPTSMPVATPMPMPMPTTTMTMTTPLVTMLALVDTIIPLAAFAPAIAALILGAAISLRRLREPAIVRISTFSLSLSLAGVLFAIVRWIQGGFMPVDIRFGHWFHAGDYAFPILFYFDGYAAAFALVTSILLLATSRFSVHYLHREPGFGRFYVITLMFGAGMQLLVMGGSFDLLFAGWELVGISSVLLVAFFHERRGPVRAAIRVLVTYRLCDVGLVLATILLHHAKKTTAFVELFATNAIPAASTVGGAEASNATTTTTSTTSIFLVLALGLVLAAAGKSAQFPLGGWLPRAMEGPTASSAVFYGGLSVHAGVFLLVRAAPLYMDLPIVRVVIILIGAITAIFATLSGQVSPDAKSSLAYATIAQVGLMFVECGLGAHTLAVLHMCAHAMLRYYQFLQTPSVLQYALARRRALGSTLADESAARWEVFGVRFRRYLYRLAIERFDVETTLERWVAEPILALSARIDRFERRLFTLSLSSSSSPSGRRERTRREEKRKKDATKGPKDTKSMAEEEDARS